MNKSKIKSEKPTLSIVLATFNEENNLSCCLESVRDIADEIVIVDGNSTDNTPQIARYYTKNLISTKNLPMFHTNKQLAIDNATGDWILQLDADEEVPLELKKEIQEAISMRC